jgi:hypothetical protein
MSYSIFDKLDKRTNAEYGQKDIPQGQPVGPSPYTTSTITFTKSIEVFTLLGDKSYYLPASSSRLLDDYIQKGWFFNIIEVDIGNLNIDSSFGKYFLPPISLSFNSNEIVYPSRLGSISLLWQDSDFNSDKVSIVEKQIKSGQTEFADDSTISDLPQTTLWQLYIISDHRVQLAPLMTKYADSISTKDIATLTAQPSGSSHYLTVLSGQVDFTKYTSDAVIVDAPTDEALDTTQAKENTSTTFWMYIVLVLMFLIITLVSPVGLSFGLGLLLQKEGNGLVRRIASVLFIVVGFIGILTLITIEYSSGISTYLVKQFGNGNSSLNSYLESSSVNHIMLYITWTIFFLWMTWSLFAARASLPKKDIGERIFAKSKSSNSVKNIIKPKPTKNDTSRQTRHIPITKD